MPRRKNKTGWASKPKKKKVVAALPPPAPPVLKQAEKSIAKLPPELRRMIGSYLVDDPVSSIFLGLTCRDFIKVHREFHKAPIHLSASTRLSDGRPRTLSILLYPMFYALGMSYLWEAGRYAYPETLLAREKTYKQHLKTDKKLFREGAKKDMERISARKEQFRNGDYDVDEWSDFSALSEDLELKDYLSSDVDENELTHWQLSRSRRPTPSEGSSSGRIDMNAIWGNGSEDESNPQDSDEANSEAEMDQDNRNDDSENDGDVEDED